MFVRWRRRKRSGRGYYGEIIHVRTAILVRSVRTNKGPRHEYVCYLATIEEGKETWPGHCTPFWDKAEAAMNKANVRGKDRKKIVDHLKTQVAWPTMAYRKAYAKLWDGSLRKQIEETMNDA